MTSIRGARAIRWVGLSVLIVIVLSMLSPSAAGATQKSTTVSAGYSTSAGILLADPAPGPVSGDHTSDGCVTGSIPSDSNLALSRWSGGTTSLHTRLSGGISDPTQKITNGLLDGMFLSAGNWAWQTAESLTQQAEQFCVLYTVGADADHIAHSIGQSLFDPTNGVSVALIFFVIGLLAAIFRARKGAGNPSAYLAKSVAILAVAFVMIAGASRTVNDGSSLNSGGGHTTNTTFGLMSPGWFAATIDHGMHVLSAIPAQSFGSANATSELSTPPTPPATSVNTGQKGTCAKFLTTMHTAYAAQVAAGDASPSAGVMSDLWETSGLLVWERAQFGSDPTATQYGDKIFCYVLDSKTGQTVGTTSDSKTTGALPGDIAKRATTLGLSGFTDPADINPGSAAFATSDNNTMDRLAIGWAACYWNGTGWKVQPDWAPAFNDNGAITDADCTNFMTSTDLSKTGSGTVFDASGDNSTTKGDAVENSFLGSWHGKVDNGSTLIVSFTFMISSLLMLIIFGGFSLMVLLAKCISLCFIIFIFFVLLLELLPSKSNEQRVVKFFKYFASMTLLSYALGLFLAVITVVTSFIVSISATTTSPGSGAAMLMLGFAPIAAVAMIHLVFKHALKLPSPLKPSSALAYGAAAGGIAGGAAGALSSAGSKARNRAESMGQRGWAKVSPGGDSRARSGRRGPGSTSNPKSGARGQTAVDAALATGPGVRSAGETAADKARFAAFTTSKPGQEQIKAKRKADRRMRAKESLVTAGRSMLERPVHTSLKAAKKVGKYAAIAAAVPAAVAIGGVPVLAAAGAYGAVKVGRAVLRRADKNRATSVGAYTESAEFADSRRVEQAQRKNLEQAARKTAATDPASMPKFEADDDPTAPARPAPAPAEMPTEMPAAPPSSPAPLPLPPPPEGGKQGRQPPTPTDTGGNSP